MPFNICLHTNFCVTPDYIGGTERFLISLAKELKILGFEPFIVCSSLIPKAVIENIPVYGIIPNLYRKYFQDNGFFSSKILHDKIFTESLLINNLKKLSDYTIEQISGFNADVYHFNSFASISFDETYSKKSVVTNHENNLECDKIWGSGFYDEFKKLVRCGKTLHNQHPHLIVPSHFYAKQFSKDFNLPIKNIPLGVNLKDFSVLTEKNEINNSNKLWKILLPSRFNIWQKGHDIALKACSILKKSNINFLLICSGVKPSNEYEVNNFIKIAKELNIESHVICKRYGDIRDGYEESDIVISPERFCSYGLSISESLSLGKKTILSNIPTYVEIAKSYRHAYFFENGNEVSLAETLQQVIKETSNSLYDAIYFRINNDIRACAKEYAKLYLSLF